MAGRVFLHIGPPKSGTTYLQDILWKNKECLTEQGILLPARRGDNFHATMVVREDPGVYKRNPTAPTAWARIVEEARAWDGTVIISHEFFGGASAEQAKRALDDLAPAEIHVVVTARDYGRVLPAAWQEWVKIRHSRSLTQFIGGDADGGPLSEWGWRTSDVVAMLDRWGRHLPLGQVHVVTVPPSSAPRDLLWRRFAGLCGIDPDSCYLSGARPNQSLGLVEVELMRRIGPKVREPIKGRPGEVTRWVRDELAHKVLAPRRGERFGLAPGDAAELRHRSQQAADTLARAGYDVVGDLAEIVPEPEGPADDSDSAPRHPDTVAEGELLDVAIETVEDMLRRYRAQAKRGDHQKRRADKAERELAETRARLVALEERVRHPWPRRVLIDLSERHPVVMKARVAYRRTVDAVQAAGRSGRR